MSDPVLTVRSRGVLRWRPMEWPMPKATFVVVAMGLMCSVSVHIIAQGVFGPAVDVPPYSGLVDKLAIIAMLPFVLLALPRHVPHVHGEPLSRPILRMFAFVATAGSLWVALVVAVSPSGSGGVAYAPVGAQLAVPVVSGTILQVTTEELLFRLLLPLVLVRAFGRSPHSAWAATVVSAVLFGLFHAPQSLAAFMDHVLFGLVMHQVLSATRRVQVPIILHVANNLFAQNFVIQAAAAPEDRHHLLVAKYVIFFVIAAVVFPRRTPWPAAAWTERFAARPPMTTPAPGVRRSTAVDALRGVALLLIMLENLLIYLPAESGLAVPSAAERGTRAVMAVLIEYRGLPLYALLLGFGVYVLVRRAATPEERATVLRRNLAFIIVGSLHGLLVFSGDILAVYGILMCVLLWATRNPRRARLMTWVCGVLFVLQTLVLPFTLAFAANGTAEAGGSYLASTATEAFMLRSPEWLLFVLSAPLLSSGLLFPMLIGFRTAHLVMAGPLSAGPARGYRASIIALGCGSVALCLPYAILLWTSWGDARVVADHPWPLVLAQLGGLCGAIASWCLVIVITPGPAEVPMAARLMATAGRRSLSLYLLHSVAFLVLLTPPLGGLSSVVPLPALAGVVAIAWVAAGVLLSRSSTEHAGLAEALIRDMAAGPAVPPRPGPARPEPVGPSDAPPNHGRSAEPV